MSDSKETVTTPNDRSSFSALAGPKRNLGRAARRRRKKLIEIQRAEEQLLRNPSSSQTKERLVEGHAIGNDTINQIIPSDRSRVWPGVEEHRLNIIKENVTLSSCSSWEKDASMLLSQLGYVPGNAIKVAARVSDIDIDGLNLKDYSCHGDEPAVLQLYPIALRDEHSGGRAQKQKFKRRKRTKQKHVQATSDKVTPDGVAPADPPDNTATSSTDQYSPPEDDFVVEPFPTMYWLVHPLLRTLVSKMELQGMGVRLEQQLAKDATAMASIERANLAYGQERYDLLTPSDLDFIRQRKWEGAFDPGQRGVAGIRNFASVKCLHAHVAHYLSNGQGSKDNILGKWVVDEISKTNNPFGRL